MSKRLRVFFLSVMVLMLAVSSAFSADEPITFLWTGEGTNTRWDNASNWSANRAYSDVSDDIDSQNAEMTYYPGGFISKKSSGEIVNVNVLFSQDATVTLGVGLEGYIASIGVESDDDEPVTVTVNLGTSNLRGKLDFNIGTAATLNINGTGTLQVGNVESTDVGAGWKISGDLALDIPVALYTDTSVDIAGLSSTYPAKMTVSKPITQYGTTEAELKVTVGSNGTLSSNQASILGKFVTISADTGTIALTGTDAISDAKPTLNLSGATIDIASGKTVELITKGISGDYTVVASGTITKAGAGELIIAGDKGTASSGYYTSLPMSRDSVVSGDSFNLKVSAGTLTLKGDYVDENSPMIPYSSTYKNSKDCVPAIYSLSILSFDVAKGATLNIDRFAVRQSGDINAVFVVTGTANLDYSGIYNTESDYDDAIVSADFAKTYISLDVKPEGTVNVNGLVAVNGLTGRGTVKVADGGELVLVSGDADAFSTFYGTVNAATVGLVGDFVGYPFTIDETAKRHATADIKTLKVYGKDSSLALDDSIEFSDDETIYLRMVGPEPTLTREFQDNINVGRLIITSGDVKLPYLKVDGAGSDANTATILLSHDSSLTVNTLELHANWNEDKVADLYENARSLVLSGDVSNDVGTFEAKTIVSPSGVAGKAHASSVIGVNAGAAFKVGSDVPENVSVIVHEAGVLDVAENVKFADALGMENGSMLKAVLTESNATEFGEFAVRVDKKLTLADNLAVTVTFDDAEIGTLDTTYWRPYSLIGVTGDSVDFVVNSGFVVSLDEEVAEVFLDSGDADADFIKSNNKGVQLRMKIDMQMVSLPDVELLSYDKSHVGEGLQFEVELPVTYNNRYSDHYKNYIVVSSDKYHNGDVVGLLYTYDPSTDIVRVRGTATKNNPTFSIKLDWIKGTSGDIVSASTTPTIRDQSVATGWNSTRNMTWLQNDNLQLSYFRPSEKTYTLSGTAEALSGDVIATGTVLTTESATLLSHDDAVYFEVTGLTEKPATATPVLVNGVYVWMVGNAGDSDKTYVMVTDEGNIDVSNLVMLIKGNGSTQTVKADDLLIEATANVVTRIGVSFDKIGLVGTSPVEYKEFSLQASAKGATDKRTVTTASETVTILNKETTAKLTPDAGTGYETLKVNSDGTTAYGSGGEVTVTLPEGFGAIKGWIPVKLPSWLESHDVAGGKAFTLKEGTSSLDIAEDSYQVSVLAENVSGDLYEYSWTITVDRDTTVETKITTSEAATRDTEVGAAYEATFTANNPVTWAVSGLPEWLSVASSTDKQLVISGTAVDAETLPQTVTYTVTAYENGVVVGEAIAVEFKVIASVFEVEDEGATPDTTYEGYNYRDVLTAKGASGKVTWTVTPANTWLKAVESGDNQLILAGVLPDYDDDDSEKNDYSFTVTASVGGVYAENASTEEPFEVEVTVEEDTTDVVAPADIVTPASGVELGKADENYSVVVTLPTDPDEEDGTVVHPDYFLDPEGINLPEWLSYRVLSEDDNGDILSLEIFSVATPIYDNGTEGTVRLPLASDTIGWDVVYEAKLADLTLTLSSTSITMKVGETATATATAENVYGTVEYLLSGDAPSWVAISGSTITAANPTASGDFTVTVIARDSRGESGQATAVLTIKVEDGETPGPGPVPGSLTISTDKTSVTFTSPSASAQTVALSSNKTGTTFTATVDKDGLTATVSGSTLTLTPSAAGSYTVTVTGTNGTETATTRVTVTVESDIVVGQDFMLQVSGDLTQTVRVNTTNRNVTLIPRNSAGTVSYTTSETWVTVNSTTGVVTINPTLASLVGTHTVTITGTDTEHGAGEDSDTVTLTVVVTGGGSVGSSGGGCDAGFGALALVLAAPLFLRRRRS